jgi:hypothetical protein
MLARLRLSSISAIRPLAVVLALFAITGCATLRGRADDALERGDYRHAVELYSQLHARDPKDERVTRLLTRAERGWLDQLLDRAEAVRKAGEGDAREALQAALEVVQAKDRLSAGSVNPPRAARVTGTVEWATATVRAAVRSETSRGRALAARERRASEDDWLKRPELAAVGPELDAEIAAAGAKTCTKATQTAAEHPFALELVAAYCKAVGGPMPAWKPRPLLVGGVVISGGIIGTPPNEQIELERAVSSAIEKSVWFTAMTDARAKVQLQGNVAATFTREQTELARPWTEQVPYEATETYQVPVSVPYVDTETYREQVPYTAYENKYESCHPPRTGMCTVTRPVTRYRDEQRTRQVTRMRTEYRTEVRQVTRYRNEPRIFRYPATKHEGRYRSTFFVSVDMGSNLRPIDARGSAEDGRVVHEHDAEFGSAGVHPERANLPSDLWWRQQQRDRVRDELLTSLERSWVQSFCSEGASSIEEAARCARARPKPAPAAVRARIVELIGDDPDRVLALPRPGEAVH